ncbi:MAG: tyrosine-type recombinase/integrase [Pirellulaceae bacterium]
MQQAAGIKLPCEDAHDHTEACHLYGFHDLRRGFATLNAGNMSGDALQKLMRHKSYSTTQRYINLAGQVNAAVATLFVPDVLNRKNA